MKVVFFNHFHNGDLHASRGIIKKIMEKMKNDDPNTSFYYSHKNDSNLLIDISNLIIDNTLIDNVNQQIPHLLNKHTNTLYINTWYGQRNNQYINRYGITFDSLYSAMNDDCIESLKFRFEDISNDIRDFFPRIDYSKFQIDNIKNWLIINTNKKILIENGKALSNQAINFDFTPIIIDLANKHKDKIFILSHKENINLSNVVYTNDIIKKQQGSDLNEISFLSTHCDVIIGRASGVFTFSLTKENLFERKIKYICFSNLIPKITNKFWLGPLFSDKVNYSANIFTTNESNRHRVFNIIDERL